MTFRDIVSAFRLPAIRLLALAVLALGAGFIAAPAPAEAQVYYSPYPHQPAPRYYPAPRYVPAPYPPSYYEEPQGYYPQRGYGRRVAYGTVCWTSRGTCPLGNPAPYNSGCRCFIPGFGKKRGYVR